MALAPLIADLDDIADAGARLHALFALAWEYEMGEYPERATSAGWAGHDHRWTDMSLEAIDRRNSEGRELLTALDTIDRAALTEDDRLSFDLFARAQRQLVEAAQFPSELLPVSRMDGIHQSVPRTIDRMSRSRIGDLDNIVARLSGVSVLVDQVLNLLDEGMRAGLTPPRVTVDDIPDQIDTLLAKPGIDNPLLAAFRLCPDTIDAGDFDDIRDEALDAMTGAASALTRLRVFLVDTYLPACRTTVAWKDLPNGEEWYAHLVRRFTTTDMSPAEIHELGLNEVTRIRSAMADVEEEAGFGGQRDAFLEFLRTDDRFFYSTAEELLQGYRDIAKRVDPELPRLFGVLPRLPYGVRAVPDHEAPTTTTAYYLRGSPPTGRPGWFAANTYDLRSRPKWEMEALTLHEAVPGHHLQISLAAELDDLPPFRSLGGYTAFVEGWGLYAESLGTEMGFYADPFSRFGQLAYEMWRAVRLVVDTGIHAFGWDRRRAIDYFAENTGKAIHDVTVEIDRYISWPGQALAYKVGQMTFSRLRATAQAALGPDFDLRAFHDFVLGAGALPLDLLEQRTTEWLASLGR